MVGSSHSAILVLMNLLEMNNGPKVLNLYRSPLKYAKFLEDGTVIRDNTGLKVSLPACVHYLCPYSVPRAMYICNAGRPDLPELWLT